MGRGVFARALRDQRKSFWWWAVGTAATVAMIMAFYPSIRANGAQLTRYMQQLPRALMALFRGSADFSSPAGYLDTELFFFVLPLMFAIFAVSAGARAVATEEERGTLDLLLATPLSRRGLVLGKFAAMIVSLAALAVVTWATLAIAAIVAGFDISAWLLGAAMLSCFLLAAAIGSIALVVGAATGRHGLAVGVAAAIGVAMYLLNSLAPLVSSLTSWRRVSLFYYYLGNEPLRNGLDLANAVVLAAVAASLAVVAIVAFDRRDLAS